jgi:hypothetical protein
VVVFFEFRGLLQSDLQPSALLQGAAKVVLMKIFVSVELGHCDEDIRAVTRHGGKPTHHVRSDIRAKYFRRDEQRELAKQPARPR